MPLDCEATTAPGYGQPDIRGKNRHGVWDYLPFAAS